MSTAEEIAARIPPPKDEGTANEEEESKDGDGKMKPGDHGRKILAAFESKDPEAIENAIKDCVDDASY